MDNNTAYKIIDEFLEWKERSREIWEAISHCVRKDCILDKHEAVVQEAINVNLVDKQWFLLDKIEW